MKKAFLHVGMVMMLANSVSVFGMEENEHSKNAVKKRKDFFPTNSEVMKKNQMIQKEWDKKSTCEKICSKEDCCCTTVMCCAWLANLGLMYGFYSWLNNRTH